jgi:hypothetical protein
MRCFLIARCTKNKSLRVFHRVENFLCRDGGKPEIFLVVEDTEIRPKML